MSESFLSLALKSLSALEICKLKTRASKWLTRWSRSTMKRFKICWLTPTQGPRVVSKSVNTSNLVSTCKIWVSIPWIVMKLLKRRWRMVSATDPLAPLRWTRRRRAPTLSSPLNSSRSLNRRDALRRRSATSTSSIWLVQRKQDKQAQLVIDLKKAVPSTRVSLCLASASVFWLTRHAVRLRAISFPTETQPSREFFKPLLVETPKPSWFVPCPRLSWTMKRL